MFIVTTGRDHGNTENPNDLRRTRKQAGSIIYGKRDDPTLKSFFNEQVLMGAGSPHADGNLERLAEKTLLEVKLSCVEVDQVMCGIWTHKKWKKSPSSGRRHNREQYPRRNDINDD